MLLIKKTLQHPKADPKKRSILYQKIQEVKTAGRTIAYIDESGFAHDMPRTHGYSAKGKSCYGTHDWGARGRTNVIGALIGKVLLTVMLLSGSVNTQILNDASAMVHLRSSLYFITAKSYFDFSFNAPHYDS